MQECDGIFLKITRVEPDTALCPGLYINVSRSHKFQSVCADLIDWLRQYAFDDPEFVGKPEDARSKFQLYGYNDEIDLMERFISAIENKNIEAVNTTLSKLLPLIRTRIRGELSIKS